MARENYQTRGKRYLVENRLVLTVVNPTGVAARVRGSGRIHEVGWHRETGWTCTCESRNENCPHIYATKCVVAVDLGSPT